MHGYFFTQNSFKKSLKKTSSFFSTFLHRIICWLAGQFIYAGASTINQISNFFSRSSPLNSKRLRQESRRDLLESYGGQELWFRQGTSLVINGMYLDCKRFQEKFFFLESTHTQDKGYRLTPDGDTVILFLGNNEFFEEEESKLRAKWYLLRGKNVMMFNYPGYGDSQGIPTHHTTDQAAHGVYNVILLGVYDDDAQQRQVKISEGSDPSQVILHGYSLGGGIAARLAGQLQRQGKAVPRLLLDRTFDNILRLAVDYLPFFLRSNRFLLRIIRHVVEEKYHYNAVRFLRKFDKKKLFIIHADFDEVMRKKTKEALSSAAKSSENGFSAPVVHVSHSHGDEWEDIVNSIQDGESLEDFEDFLRKSQVIKASENTKAKSGRGILSKLRSFFKKIFNLINHK